MVDETAAAAAAATPAAILWHTGVEAEMLGHWQNKGWKTDDPKEVAVAATKQARELERHFGVPADQLLKMPKADAPEADIKAFHQRLGAPADPKDYDFSTIKTSDGKDVPPAFLDSMRAAFAANFVAKDRATALAAAVVKYAESEKQTQDTIRQGLLTEQKAALDKDWGPNKDLNRLRMVEGAQKLGLSEAQAIAVAEAVATSGAGKYGNIVDAFRKIGANTSEDAFHDGGKGGGNPTTAAGAQARLAELQADPAWGKRLTSGDAAALAEWRALTTQIAAAA